MAKNIIGLKFNRLTIIEDLGIRFVYNVYTRFVNAMCDCGKVKEYRLGHIKSGSTKSCGCFRKESVSNRNSIHNLSKHPLMSIWNGIIERCTNENSKVYKKYGGNGITICDEWKEFLPFYTWAINNGWRKGLQIDKDIKGGKIYSPGNCLFVTPKINSRNKGNSLFFLYKGETKCLKEWSEILSIPYTCLHMRLTTYKMPVEIAFTKPLRK